MRTPIAVSLLLFLGLLSAAGNPFGASADGASPPVAVVPEPRFDAGFVVRGTVIEKSFPIRNSGGERLRITNLESSCNCAAADYTPSIEPGAQGSATIRIETDDLSGPIEKFIVAHTNDPAAPRIRVTVTATVEDVIQIIPGRTAYLGEIPREETTIRRWGLRSEDGTPLRITGVDLLEGCAEYEVESAEEGKVAILKLTIPPHFEVKSGSDVFFARFAVRTDHPRMPLLHLKAHGEIKDRLRRAPAEVKFGRVGRKALEGGPDIPAPSRDITVLHIGSEPLTITSISSFPDFLRTARLEEAEYGNPVIHLSIAPGAPSGVFNGWVKVETNLGKLLWPVSGNIK